MKFTDIRELFRFTRRERTGIIALLIVIFIFAGINISLPYLVRNKPADTSAWEAEIKKYAKRNENPERQTGQVEIRQFDPNKIRMDELIQMGVPARIATNWTRYLEKGGRFREAKDIRKIYGMTEELFDRLQNYICIQAEKRIDKEIRKDKSMIKNLLNKTSSNFNLEEVSASIDSVELNLADSAELEHLPGIGPVLAARIIRYRKLLGGFYSVIQLKEIYGLREEHYSKVLPHLYIKGELFGKFNINFASLEKLGRHPYIGFRKAREIVSLRDKKGKFTSLNDLSEIMTADSIGRLGPYLKFNE